MSEAKTGDDLAFPFVSHGGVHEHQYVETGMSKREFFAAKAMQGVLADSYIMDLIRCDDEKDTAQFVAGLAVEYADALLEELERDHE